VATDFDEAFGFINIPFRHYIIVGVMIEVRSAVATISQTNETYITLGYHQYHAPAASYSAFGNIASGPTSLIQSSPADDITAGEFLRRVPLAAAATSNLLEVDYTKSSWSNTDVYKPWLRFHLVGSVSTGGEQIEFKDITVLYRIREY
jgi:hypothetical protein